MTIEEALQRAIEYHQGGRLQDAERLYRAILQNQPQHPDANHNLGVLLASLNNTVVALQLFKIALEANPNQKQFWLSYVGALIKENQLENARDVLEQGKKKGVAGIQVDGLEAKLSTIFVKHEYQSPSENRLSTFLYQNKKTSIDKKRTRSSIKNFTKINQTSKSPPQIELSTLLDYFKNEQYELAQNLATTLTQQYPKHPFGWKVLGALFKQTGKLLESVNANQKVLKISPNDEEAHYNLGTALNDLGRLGEAERSYNKAIAIKADMVVAHSNLGNTLKDLGRLEEAEASYKKAIAIKPEYAQAHSNLGITLKEIGNVAEAEASYKKAIAINSDYVEAHYNLGILLKENGRIAEAEKSFSQAVTLKPAFIKARNEMLTCLYLMDKKSLFFKELDYLIKENIANSVVGSLTCRSILRYDEEKPNIFCNDPLKHVLLVDLKSQYNFEEIFSQKINSFLNESKRSIKKQNTLLNGFQTSGNLFAIEKNFINEIQKFVRAEIERYRINFENSQEGLIRKWPTEYSLYGWLISMKSGGELLPHIHENGWLSGSIYINVPPKKTKDSGNLVVALGKDSDATDPSLNSKKVIDVVTGSMVLFPASLMHHTIPFESDEERIVLAFDVVPKSP